MIRRRKSSNHAKIVNYFRINLPGVRIHPWSTIILSGELSCSRVFRFWLEGMLPLEIKEIVCGRKTFSNFKVT